MPNFAMKNIVIFLLVVPCLLMTGCDVFMPKTTARVVAKPYAKPVLAALEAYHKSHNHYPKTLDELRSEYPKPLEGFQSKDDGTLYTKVKGEFVDWTLSYRQETSDSYVLLFQRGETFVVYKNGKVISADSKWWM